MARAESGDSGPSQVMTPSAIEKNGVHEIDLETALAEIFLVDADSIGPEVMAEQAGLSSWIVGEAVGIPAIQD